MGTLTNKATSQTSDKRCAHAKGFFRKAPAEQSLAVILWDEAESARRTGSGNLIQVNVTTGSRG